MAYGFVEIIRENAETDDSLDLGYGFKSGDSRTGRALFETQGYILDSITLSDTDAESVMKEAENYVIENHYYYRFYHEGHDSLDEISKVIVKEIKESSCYVIVKDGHFYGVAMHLKATSGNGWNGFSYERGCLLLSDGTVIGNNKDSEHYSGEETEKTEESTYYLKVRGE